MEFVEFDDAYLERLRVGDFRTQEHFVAYFTELIHLKLRSRLRSAHQIEDVRQETLTRVFAAVRSGGCIQEPEKFGAFVNATCNRVLWEMYRSSARHSGAGEECYSRLASNADDPLRLIMQEQTAEKVRQVVEDLSEKDRCLLKDIFLQERDKDQVCEEYGVDRDYFRVLLHRAKRNFRALYLSTARRTGSAGGR